ncbi:FYVE and coiled-coil domain-containing protein 1-like isoform X2 [Amphiura filiformis]|uniref:FYVE and coiled-coil domain-containing protein 1-like isoform X2 n=1 Tax=Amphiura filiformis TaxID=82378 RepID=UPI003B224D89
MAQTKLPKIVQDIKDCLHDVKKEYQEGQVPITDDSIPLHKFCAKLEYLLQIDMKARNSVWRGRVDYWDYIYQCLSKIKGLNDGVRYVKAMNEVKSSLGRGRAFIRYSLVHHRLGDSLQQCFSNAKVTSDWYKPASVLSNPAHYSAFLNDLYDLNDIQFDLAPTGHDLDTAWPTFARKSLGGNSFHVWAPVSRSSSISSLSSQPSTTDGLASPLSESAAVFGMEEQYQKLNKEFEECEELNRQLRQKIEQLEKDNEDMHKLALETEERMDKVQSDLERRNQDLEYKVDKGNRDLKRKEEEMSEFEDAKERTKEAEKLNADLYARIDVLNTQHESREKILQESERTLQEKLQENERALSDVKLQVHSLQGELEARKSSEERRVGQVQELEAKINSVEGKNVELLARMEGMVQDKDDKVSSHFESANKVHELLAKLEGVEHQNIGLKGTNDELSRKVQELEELRTRSNSEVEILRGSLEERGKEMDHNNHQVGEKLVSLENENSTLRTKNEELLSKFEQLEKKFQDLEREKNKSEEHCQQLQTEIDSSARKETKLKEEKEELRTKCKALEKSKRDLGQQVQSLERSKKEADKTNQRLKGQGDEVAESMEVLAKKVTLLESERDRMRQDYDGIVSGITDIIKSSQVEIESCVQSTPYKDLKNVDSNLIQDGERTMDKVKAVIDIRTKILQTLLEADKSISRLESELQSSKERLQQEEELHEKTKSDLENASFRINEFESQVKIMTSDFDNHKISAEKANVEYSQLQKSVNEHEVSVSELKNRLQTSQKELQELKTEKESTASKLAELEKNKTELNEAICCLEGENQALVKAKNVMKNDFDKEKIAKKGMEEMVEDLKRTQEENVSMEQVLEDRKQKMVQEHEDKVEFLTQQFNMVKEDIEKANQEKQRLDDEHKEMSEEHKAMREQLEMALKEKNETKEVNQHLNAEIASVNEQIETAQEERKEIANKLEQISDETTSQLTDKATKISELEAELEQTVKVKGELESKVGEIQEMLDAKTSSYEELEEKLKEVEEQLGSMQCVMEQEVSALKFQLSSEAMQFQEKLQVYKHQEGELEKLREKCQEQDQLIESQQMEENQLKEQLETMRDDSAKQITDVQNKTVAKEKDFNLLQDSLAEMTKMLEEQKVANLNLEEEIHSLKSDVEDREVHLREQLSLAETDNLELKKNLVKLVKEKDTLWQWTDKLEHQRKLKASERWLEDKEVVKCMQCEVEFGIMVRRHHCRSCGRIFCSKCCNSFILGAQSKNKVRVCEQCFVIHHHSRESDSINTSLLGQSTEEEEVDDALLTSRLRLSSHASTTSTPDGNGNGEEGEARIGPLLGPGDLQQSNADDSTRAKFVVGSASSTPTPPMSPIATGDISITDGSTPKQVENPVIVLDSPLPGAQGNVTEDDSKDSSEPDFDIISEEEVQSAKEEDSITPAKSTKGMSLTNSVVSAVMTTKELEAGFGCDAEIQIRAGHSHSIPILLDEPGLILCWEFASAPKTIAFSVTYKQAETSETYEELIPLCKCNSHRHAVQGELMSRKAGVYTLVFDNQFSRFTAKVIKYSLQIKRPEAAY